LLVYRDQPDATKGRILAQFLWWAIHDGQKQVASLYYAPLPAAVVVQIEASLRSITVQGRSVLADR
jgi:phosphate transport system substrate-binding protein